MPVQALSELAPGTLFGRYRIQRLLGRGGMDSVYAAEQLDDGRTVALKVLSTTLDTSEDRARVLREGRIAASINHPTPSTSTAPRRSTAPRPSRWSWWLVARSTCARTSTPSARRCATC